MTFEAFKKSVHSFSDVKTWADEIIDTVENTEIGWGNEGLQIIRSNKNKLLIVVKFDLRPTADKAGIPVDSESDGGMGDSNGDMANEEAANFDLPDAHVRKLEAKIGVAPTDTVLNLQYFFPLCDRALMENQRRQIILVIYCGKDDAFRVQRYLGLQAQIKKRLGIYIAFNDGAELSDETRLWKVRYYEGNIRALLPLLCVGESRYVTCTEDNDVNRKYALTVKCLAENNNELSKYIKKRLLSLREEVIAKVKARNNGSKPADKSNTESRDITQYAVLLRAGYSFIDAINIKIMGNATKAETIDERIIKIQAFWNIVLSSECGLQRHPLLTQIIWLNILYSLNDQDVLTFDGQTGAYSNSQFFFALWDAVAYGEGVLQLLENSELHSQHHIGYLSVYAHKVDLGRVSEIAMAAERRTRIFRKYRLNLSDSVVGQDESCYLELNVTDMGRDKTGSAKGVEVMSGRKLNDLFVGLSDESENNVIHHYGLPLFYRTVIRKNGRFVCRTPLNDTSAVQFLAGHIREKKTQPSPSCECVETGQVWTGYQVLLPVTFQQAPTESIKTVHQRLFDSSFLSHLPLPFDYKQREIKRESFFPELDAQGELLKTAEGKIKLTNMVGSSLCKLIDTQTFNDTVFELSITKLSLVAFDLYIKGLFHCIAKMQDELKGGNRCQPWLLFRLVFTDVFAISEAVRRFSIFYDRFGKNKWMEHVQIALCEESGDGNSNVRLILAGSDIHQAYITAKQWMYYNVDLDSGFLLSQVEYLVSYRSNEGINGTVPCVPLFPFDLVKGNNGESDFSRKLDLQLDRDFQGIDCGCKIEKAHIRLGSKIHIEDFYDAELLFQSVSNIYRFAYLLAGDIRHKFFDSGNMGITKLYLIGYENYSSILVDEVKCLLEDLLSNNTTKNPIDISHVQYIKKTNGIETITPEREMVNTSDEQAACIIILPVGTTLSTIYKIKNVFYRKCGASSRPELLGSYVLILVGDDSELGTSNGYWEYDTNCPNQVILGAENNNDPAKVKVSWLFLRKTKWMRPDQCNLCGGADVTSLLTHIPLGQVDKTSTIPELIYPVRNSNMNHGIGFTAEKHGDEFERLKKMKGCIDYGHIHRETNHYLFYINFEEYYERVRGACIKWLDGLRNTIDENEFNIIVSPLQYESNLFLKDVVDHVFQHCLRFLYLPLDQVYREEIRSRFSYIAKEYQDACKNGSAPKYNVYYVDYSIVSGQTMNRSKSLLQMLMNDASAGVNIQIYRKVILLTNRSSFDTAAVYVSDPREDFVSFSTLRIPSYNTLGNKCPACEMVDMYKRVAKQSATNELYWHYMSLAEKHKLCTPDEHVEMQRNMHFSSPHYLHQFCQMLYLEDDLGAETKCKRKVVINALKTGLEKLSIIDYSQLTIKDMLEAVGKNKVLERYYTGLVSERNWRRMICTHNIIVIIEQLSGSDWKDETVREALWSGIIDSVMDQGVVKDGNLDNIRREWLISYIKSCSRGYPSQFAPIRKAAYTLLELLFRDLLAQNLSSDGNGAVTQDSILDNVWEQTFGKKDTTEFRNLLKLREDAGPAEVIQFYQLYQILAKRLCDMRSNLLLEHDVLKDTDRYISVLRNQYYRSHNENEIKSVDNFLSNLLPFPSNMQIQSDYLHLIKWTAMGSKDGAKSLLLQRLAQSIFNERRDPSKMQEEYEILNTEEFAQLICTENTRVLYSGIKRLDERISKSVDMKEESIASEIQTCIEAAKVRDPNEENRQREKHIKEPQYLEQNPMRDLLHFIDTDFELGFDVAPDLHGKLLTPLLGFYRQIMDMNSDDVFVKRKNYVERYNLLCYYLAKIGGYENCCMVHRSNNINQIIAKSVLSGDVENLEETVDALLEKATTNFVRNNNSQMEDMNLKNTILVPDNSTDNYMVIALRISRHPQVKFLQTIYIILFREDIAARLLAEQPSDIAKSNNYMLALLDARNIRSHYLLFMRQRLQTLLERDLYALHHFRSGLEDVHRIYQNQPLCILHITDLHISAQNQNAIKLLLKSNKNELKKDNPELMVITGDVVQGDNVAVDLEENYRYAAEIITEIARILWSEKSRDGKLFLRNDWKKRIVIIPGNHDYASMNELSAIHSLRVTTGGAPAARNGTPMSKFAYYIQFLQNLLDIDSSQSIRSNLNSVLEYPDLQLRIIALNSISEVGPMRNNKMQLDKSFVEHVAQRPKSVDKYYCNLCLAHHTRCYAPDYFADRYYEKNMPNNIIAYAKRIMECCLNHRDTLIDMDASEREKTVTKVSEELKAIQNNDPASFTVFREDYQGTALYSDVDYVISHWYELTDERSAQILADYKRNKVMAGADLRTYHERLRVLESSFGRFFMLGGHTHRPGKTKTWTDKSCVEGARFYSERDDKTTLNFGRLLISKKGDAKKGDEWQFKYVFTGKIAIQTIEDKGSTV